jgi:hypothetical protein
MAIIVPAAATDAGAHAQYRSPVKADSYALSFSHHITISLSDAAAKFIELA